MWCSSFSFSCSFFSSLNFIIHFLTSASKFSQRSLEYNSLEELDPDVVIVVLTVRELDAKPLEFSTRLVSHTTPRRTRELELTDNYDSWWASDKFLTFSSNSLTLKSYEIRSALPKVDALLMIELLLY